MSYKNETNELKNTMFSFLHDKTHVSFYIKNPIPRGLEFHFFVISFFSYFSFLSLLLHFLFRSSLITSNTHKAKKAFQVSSVLLIDGNIQHHGKGDIWATEPLV